MQQSSKVQRKTLSRWSILTPEEASGRKVLLSAKREAVAVYTKYLNLSEDQQEKMTLLYDNGLITDIKFRNLDEKDQLEATTMLGINHLDLDARERPDSRWSIKWSKGSGWGEGETRQVLYQWYVIIKMTLDILTIYIVTVVMITYMLGQKSDTTQSTLQDV